MEYGQGQPQARMGPAGARVAGSAVPRQEQVLTADALIFVSHLTRRFGGRLEGLLAARSERQRAWCAGERPGLLEPTRAVREAAWTVARAPRDLERRVVEITGPVERKMIINALNSGADVFMADFEDATSPTWDNVIQGQVNLWDAVRREIEFTDPRTGKRYRLAPRPATLMVRPRGLHLPERHVEVDGRAVPAALFDFGLFFFHNAQRLVEAGSGPYFYLPKLESHLEARWWNDVFVEAQRIVGLPPGTIRATVLIETLPAAFEMDEILYELRQHSAGLNCGRWDYIFSFIKVHRADPAAVLPDRSQVTMEQPFLRAYTRRVVRTCHRRGAHALGGMAAQIPIRDDPEASRRALEPVRADKLREVGDGHDGTWVAHPGLVALAREAFESRMSGPNQLGRPLEGPEPALDELLRVPGGTRTENGLRWNLRVGLRYLAAWLCGTGCVPLFNLMEDAATAEICRAQVWQWRRHGARLEDGRIVTSALVQRMLSDELRQVAAEVGRERFVAGRLAQAGTLLSDLCHAEELADFLTCSAYDVLDRPVPRARLSAI
jgi:malate synthase